MNFYQDVINFRKKFGLKISDAPNWNVTDEWLDYRNKLMKEEFQELITAQNLHDLPEIADALADLIYVALGTAAGLGFDFNSIWNSVHLSNMNKVRTRTENESKRKNMLDLIKPHGWNPPNIEEILDKQTIAWQNGMQNWLTESGENSLNPWDEAKEISLRKAKDYQNSTIERKEYFPFGELSYLQMLIVKITRLKSLTEEKREAKNESVRDTLLDLMNYTAFWIEAIDKGEIK